MIESARVKTTSDILKLVKDRPADSMISDYFRHNRYIGAKDKKAILNRFYRIMRNWYKLRWYMERYSIQPSTFYLILLDAALNGEDTTEIFDNGTHSFPELDEKQAKLYSSMSKETLVHKDMPDQIKLECNDEYWALFSNTFTDSKELYNELEAMQHQAPFDLRVNLIKTTRDEIIDEVEGAQPMPISPFGMRLEKRININELECFKKGAIEVQDEGSQLIAMIVDAKAKDSIVDFCAGAGGKSLAMAGTMGNKGRITACDIFESKLKRAKQRFKRADVQNTATKVLDGNSGKWLSRNNGKIDKVLVDAPCSGSGTWRRNPDMKIRAIDIEKITRTQGEILQKACKLVKRDGNLFYATCSMFNEENEGVIEKFLENNPDFKLEKIEQDFVGENNGYFHSSPYKTQTDGFFVAKLKRN